MGDGETFLAGGSSRPESPPWVWEAGVVVVVVAPAWLCGLVRAAGFRVLPLIPWFPRVSQQC